MWSDSVMDVPSASCRVRIIKAAEKAGLVHSFPALERNRETAPSLHLAAALQESDGGRACGENGTEVVSVTDTAHDQAEALLAQARVRCTALMAEGGQRAAELVAEGREQAREFVTAARAEVQRILDQAASDSLAKLAEAQIAAQAQRDAAHQEVIALTARAVEEAASIRSEATAHRAALAENAAPQLVRLAVAIAEQIIRAELTLHPEALMPMLQAALNRFKGEEELHLRVSPAMLDLLETERGHLLAATELRRLDVEGDLSLAQGEFTLHGKLGMTDGRVGRQVQIVAQALEVQDEPC